MPPIPVVSWLKVGIAIAVLLAIAYEQFWVYSQGKIVGQAACVAESLQNAKAQAEENLTLRKTEREEADNVSRRNAAAAQKKINGLVQLNEQLKNTTCAVEFVPESVIGVFNAQSATDK